MTARRFAVASTARTLRRAAVRALGDLRSRPVAKAVAFVAMAASLTLVAVLGLAALNLARLHHACGDGAYLTVYLDDSVSDADAQAMARALAAVPAVARAHVVDPDEAYRRLRHELGDRAGALDGLDGGFLPRSIEVTLRDGAAAVVLAHPLVERIRGVHGVVDVELSADYAVEVGRLLSLGCAGSLLLAGVVLLAALYVAGAATRVAALARRDELDLLALVGATDRAVSGPFLLAGALAGLLAASVAALAAYGAYRLVAPHIEAALDFALHGERVTFARPGLLALWLLAGLAVGLCGSALAFARVRRVAA